MLNNQFNINNLKVDNDVILNLTSVKLTIKQFLFFGIHLGHTKENIDFLSAWVFYGWHKNIFILNLIKTFFSLKTGLNFIKFTISKHMPFFFVSMNRIYGPFISRYALLCGEPFNIYHWISGTLSNFEYVISWNYFLQLFYKKKMHKIRYMDKKQLSSFYGFSSKFCKFKRPKKKWVEVENMNKQSFIGKVNEFVKNHFYDMKDQYEAYDISNLNKAWKYLPKTKIFGHDHIKTKISKFLRIKIALKIFNKVDYYLNMDEARYNYLLQKYDQITKKFLDPNLAKKIYIIANKKKIKKNYITKKFKFNKSDYSIGTSLKNKKKNLRNSLLLVESNNKLNYKFFINKPWNKYWYNKHYFLEKFNESMEAFYEKKSEFLLSDLDDYLYNSLNLTNLIVKRRLRKFFFNKNDLYKNFLNFLIFKKSKSKIRQKLFFLKNFNNILYDKIVLNLKYLHSTINWQYLSKCNKFIYKKFWKHYLLKQNNIIKFFSKNINFDFINYFNKNLKFFKNKDKLLKNNFNLLLNLKNIYLKKENKLKIFNFILNLNNYYKTYDINNIYDENYFIEKYNNYISILNNNKLIQKEILKTLLFFNKKNEKLLNSINIMQDLKKKIKKKQHINTLKKKKHFYLNYNFKIDEKKIKKLKKKEIKENKDEFFKYYRFKKYYKDLQKFKFTNSKNKGFFIRRKKKNESKYNVPGGGFVPTVLDNPNVIDEFGLTKIPFLSLVDSNIRSVGIYVPIAANDDSIQSVNFFSFLISKIILISKSLQLVKFKKILKQNEKLLKVKYKFIFLNYLKMSNLKKDEYFKNETKKEFNFFLSKILYNCNNNKLLFKKQMKYTMFIPHEADYVFIENKILKLNLNGFKYYNV